MKIVIINCHWDNRGDEAAIRAMIDELRVKYPSADIYVYYFHLVVINRTIYRPWSITTSM